MPGTQVSNLLCNHLSSWRTKAISSLWRFHVHNRRTNYNCKALIVSFRLAQKKTEMLRSPKFHVSRTRLIIYNLPKSMSEEQVKKLCIDAVLFRASKQKPVIQMVKLLKDVKKGQVVVKKHPRAVAFVDFKEHEHALVVLRVLNNNPETFGPENRPVVEFAVENIHKIKHRKAKLESSNENHGNVEDGITGQQQSSSPRTADADSSQSHKKKLRSLKDKKGHNKSSKESEPTEGTVENPGEIKEGSIVGSRSKAGKQKRSVIRRKIDSPAKLKHGKSVNTNSHQEGTGSGKQQKTTEKLQQKDVPSQSGELKPKKEPISVSEKRKSQTAGEEHQKARKNPKRRKKEAAGREEEDKLDRLIEKYRSKFSQRSSDKSKDATSSGHKEVRRWFES